MKPAFHARRWLAAFVLCAAALPALAIQKPRQTEKCGTATGYLGVHVFGPTATVTDVRARALVSPALFWSPLRLDQSDYPWGKSSLVLSYPELQDLFQIGRDVQRVLAADRETVVYWHTLACPASGWWPPVPFTSVVHEVRNNETGEYRLAASPEERRTLLSDDRWQLTGESIAMPSRAQEFPSCGGLDRVVRFSRIGDQGLGTQVLTADPGECGALRASGDWYLADVPFEAARPYLGQCPQRFMPVMRLFNASPTAPNHRYTARRAIYDEMINAGWIGEGIAFCVPDGKPAYP